LVTKVQIGQDLLLAGINVRTRLKPESIKITPNASMRMIPRGAITHALHWKANIQIYHIVATETIIFDNNANTAHNCGESEPDI